MILDNSLCVHLYSLFCLLVTLLCFRVCEFPCCEQVIVVCYLSEGCYVFSGKYNFGNLISFVFL